LLLACFEEERRGLVIAVLGTVIWSPDPVSYAELIREGRGLMHPHGKINRARYVVRTLETMSEWITASRKLSY